MSPLEQLELCARAALAHDFDPVPWADAPEWRKQAAIAVARSALASGSADQARMAWFNEMVAMGWRWDRVLDESKKTHPGVVMGELTKGGSRHWENVVREVRTTGRAIGARMLGP